MTKYHLGFIGAGNMAEAIARGVIRTKRFRAEELIAADPANPRRMLFKNDLGVHCTSDNRRAARNAEILLVAVKPQQAEAVLSGIADAVPDTALVITIMAGIGTGLVESALGDRGRVVRVMPNTPMLVGAGVSAICPGKKATREDLHKVEAIFSAAGTTVHVSEEAMNAITAVSGSGPAYFFYLVEAMIAGGVRAGLDEKIAEQLASQTCLGAGQMLTQKDLSAVELRQRVTSPGGTTQAAVECLDAGKVNTLIADAVSAAAQRAEELGK